MKERFFPTLSDQQVLEKVRRALRYSTRYHAASPKPRGHKLSYACDFDELHLYPIGDVHIGAMGFMERAFKKHISTIEQDKRAAVVLLGDIIDNATLGSKGNPYGATMTPQKQKERAIELLSPVRDKIIGAVYGNHCTRTFKQTGTDIMYDILMGLGVLDKYCGSHAYIKIKVKEVLYALYCSHNLGKSEQRLKNTAREFQGVDLLLGGHIHIPKVLTVGGKDRDGRTIEKRVVITNAWLQDEEYAIDAAYEVAANTIPHITLDGQEKRVTASL